MGKPLFYKSIVLMQIRVSMDGLVNPAWVTRIMEHCTSSATQTADEPTVVNYQQN